MCELALPAVQVALPVVGAIERVASSVFLSSAERLLNLDCIVLLAENAMTPLAPTVATVREEFFLLFFFTTTLSPLLPLLFDRLGDAVVDSLVEEATERPARTVTASVLLGIAFATGVWSKTPSHSVNIKMKPHQKRFIAGVHRWRHVAIIRVAETA